MEEEEKEERGESGRKDLAVKEEGKSKGKNKRGLSCEERKEGKEVADGYD